MIIFKKITYSSFFSLPLIGHGLPGPLEVKHPIKLHTNHIEPKCQTREQRNQKKFQIFRITFKSLNMRLTSVIEQKNGSLGEKVLQKNRRIEESGQKFLIVGYHEVLSGGIFFPYLYSFFRRVKVQDCLADDGQDPIYFEYCGNGFLWGNFFQRFTVFSKKRGKI